MLATDVQYAENSAIAAAVLFHDWQTNEVERSLTKRIENIEGYEPGAFYKRELPCIMALLEEVTASLDFIVIDGYVTLGQHHKPGLCTYLYQQLDQSVPIIGVAKNRFIDTPEACEVLRGQSQKPLFVTSAGLSLETAKQIIRQMHGEHRLPTLLKSVDQLCRGVADTTPAIIIP